MQPHLRFLYRVDVTVLDEEQSAALVYDAYGILESLYIDTYVHSAVIRKNFNGLAFKTPEHLLKICHHDAWYPFRLILPVKVLRGQTE